MTVLFRVMQLYQFPSQQNWPADVRFGSITAALPPKWRVRFTPKSCRDIRSPSRQLRAKSGQSAPQQFRDAECQIPTLLSRVFD
jgi:hypothetical protein